MPTTTRAIPLHKNANCVRAFTVENGSEHELLAETAQVFEGGVSEIRYEVPPGKGVTVVFRINTPEQELTSIDIDQEHAECEANRQAWRAQNERLREPPALDVEG